MEKITKANSSKFNKELKKFILNELKGTEIDNTINECFDFHRFEVDTIVGKMTIAIEGEQGYVYSVFCRFENVGEAKFKFPCNSYTGKYNLHFSPIPIKEAIEVAKEHLKICKG